MTGKHLYELFAVSCAANVGWRSEKSVLPRLSQPPVAWPFLSGRDQYVWDDLARRITPRKSKSS